MRPMAMDGPKGRSFPPCRLSPPGPQKMPMRQESSRQTMFAASPRKVPVINKSLISPPPIASTPLIFSKSSTMTKIVPATTKAPSRASRSAGKRLLRKKQAPHRNDNTGHDKSVRNDMPLQIRKCACKQQTHKNGILECLEGNIEFEEDADKYEHRDQLCQQMYPGKLRAAVSASTPVHDIADDRDQVARTQHMPARIAV